MTTTAKTAKSAKRAVSKATTGKNDKGEIVMTKAQMEKLIKAITEETLKALLSQTLSQVEVVSTPKATPKNGTTKKTTKAVVAKVSKPNPVKARIEQEQKELALVFGGKAYGSKTSGDFIAFYRAKENGSYTRIGHFNAKKGLFWFTKKAVTFKDWAYIKAQLGKYSNAADFERNSDRFARAGIKCPSDFSKVNWERFLNSGIFC